MKLVSSSKGLNFEAKRTLLNELGTISFPVPDESKLEIDLLPMEDD